MNAQQTIGSVMTRAPYAVDAADTLDKVKRVFYERAIHHLPVLKDGALFGVITDRDLKLIVAVAGGSIGSSLLSAGDVCVTDAYVVAEDAPLRDVLRTMHERRLGSVIIAEGATPIGIFTVSDAVRVLLGRLGD